MSGRRPRRLAVTPVSFAVALVLLALAAPAPRAIAAGSDALAAVGQVSVTSLLGSETIQLAGTATVQRSDPYLEGGRVVVDLEVAQLELSGMSLTGPITVSQSPTQASLGELRGPDLTSLFPASSFFDAHIEAEAPANPEPTITLSNVVPLHMVPMYSGFEVPLHQWPPSRYVTYVADADPCVPLLPTLPMEACITALSVSIRRADVGGVAELARPEEAAGRVGEKEASGISAGEAGFVSATALGAVLALTAAGRWLRRRTER